MPKLMSSSIDRTKLKAITDDFETIKYFENIQRDIGSVSGTVTDNTTAIAAAQATADSATLSASNANAAAVSAQATAVGAQSAASTAQSTANSAATAASGAQTTANSALSLANTINANYANKAAGVLQAFVSSVQAPSYVVAGLKVVGARDTGWTAGTGTPYKGAFAANTTYSASAIYTQSEAAAAYAAQTQSNQRILAIESAMRAHGLID